MENVNTMCLFCGEQKIQHWDQQTKYYECNCKDAILNRTIDRKMCQLESDRPTHRYKISRCLEKIK